MEKVNQTRTDVDEDGKEETRFTCMSSFDQGIYLINTPKLIMKFPTLNIE